MKKLLLISLLIGAMPLAMMAQDDDLYFVPKKKQASKVEKVTEIYTLPSEAQYEGSNRTVDEYNRRTLSTYEVIDGDSTKLDVIDFTEGKGVYPDSLQDEDFKLTKKMLRFEDYDISNNAAFWAGYHIGLSYWHSPWYYSRYGWGWYDPWYDPWYFGGWYSSYYPWYDPWYYPYGYGYYAWYSPYYYGWGYPYYYYAWGYPYYYGGGGHSHYYGHTGNAGTIDRRGGSHHPIYGSRGSIANNSQRSGSLRDRASRMSGGQVYSSGNSNRSRSGNFGGYRGSSSNSSRGTYNSGSSSSHSSGSYSSGGGRSSGGGGFSGGGGRSSGGGGGGGRMGGRR